jgi:hypothetical protein
MTDYPQWPFEVSQINRGDRALRELLGAAYYPGPVREGEPASGERQAFVPGVFGNIFDVLVASGVTGVSPAERHAQDARATAINAIDAYRAIVVGGEINWTLAWIKKLQEYVRNGGTVVLNAAQVKGLPSEFLGVRFTGATGESHNATCLSPNEPPQEMHGGIFRFDQFELKGAQALITTPSNEPLVTVNKVGRGKVVLVGVHDLLGEDERIPPFVAHLLVHLATDATPVHVDGDVEYLVNRNSRGWVVTLFNDNGVFKPQQGLSQVDRSASVQVKLSLRGAPLLSANEWTADQAIAIQKLVNQPDSVTVNIAPGGIAVVELVTTR